MILVNAHNEIFITTNPSRLHNLKLPVSPEAQGLSMRRTTVARVAEMATPMLRSERMTYVHNMGVLLRYPSPFPHCNAYYTSLGSLPCSNPTATIFAVSHNHRVNDYAEEDPRNVEGRWRSLPLCLPIECDCDATSWRVSLRRLIKSHGSCLIAPSNPPQLSLYRIRSL